MDIKSAWWSTINWTQAVAVLASVITVFGIDLPPQEQAYIVAAITGVQGLITWYLRTYRTPTVTPSVATKLLNKDDAVLAPNGKTLVPTAANNSFTRPSSNPVA